MVPRQGTMTTSAVAFVALERAISRRVPLLSTFVRCPRYPGYETTFSPTLPWESSQDEFRNKVKQSKSYGISMSKESLFLFGRLFKLKPSSRLQRNINVWSVEKLTLRERNDFVRFHQIFRKHEPLSSFEDEELEWIGKRREDRLARSTLLALWSRYATPSTVNIPHSVYTNDPFVVPFCSTYPVWK